MTPASIRATVKELFGKWSPGALSVAWLLAAAECGSVDAKVVREWMGYGKWFDTRRRALEIRGYIKDGKLQLPETILNPKYQTIELCLIGMEVDGLVQKAP